MLDTKDISHITSLSRNSSPSRDVRDSPECTQVAKQSNNRNFNINMLIKEIVFCLALILTTYGALHNSPSKISKHPQAVRFFSPQSVVTDWYRGQLTRALSYVTYEEISFIMYYAPWDAESRFVRDEFDKAATVMHDRVHFAAINCWNPGSECRLQNNKIPSWPVLMVYIKTGRGILYKGPRDAHSMVKFLELIIKPLERISSTEDFVHLLSICDAVAVGFTPLSTSSKYYSIWYHTAVKSKEYDVIGEICFAAVTSEELANDLGVDNIPSARLMLWNETKEYNIDEDGSLSWNETSLLSWVLESFIQPVARIIPLWKKSFNFERFVENPILILFTPLNPLYQQLPSYDLLREVAMEYYNCNDNVTSQWTNELIKLQQVQRLLYQQKDFDKLCQDYKFNTPVRKASGYYKKNVVSHNNKYPWSNVTQKIQKSSLFNFLVERGLAISKLMEVSDDNSDLLASLGLLQCSTALPSEKNVYDPQKCQLQDGHLEIESDVLKRYWGSTETSMLPFDDDPLGPNNLVQNNVKHFCKLMKFAKDWGPIISPSRVDGANLTKIQGLSCATNFTLNILAVDSVQNHHFAESLGIDIINKKDKTVVVILDKKHESQYVLSEPYSGKSVREFIANFTRRALKRSLRSRVARAAHTHSYGARAGAGPADLTTAAFRRLVRKPGQVSLVAVCGGACSGHVTRALVAAGRLLRACGVAATTARIDARAHDLPWPYTPHAYPAVLAFSTRSDGRAYPLEARVSAGGLVALALRSLGMPAHLSVRLALCARTKVIVEKKSCLRDLKEHMTSVIDRNLKYWRRTEDKRLKDAFLRRLQYLHQVSLQLSLLHISDLHDESTKQKTLLDSILVLSNNWDINVFLERNTTVLKRS